MFIEAVCDGNKCLVNTDYIIEVYDLDKGKVRAFTMDINYPYYIEKNVWEKYLNGIKEE